MRLANTEFIITTDADCIPPPTWVEVMLASAVERNAAFVAAPVKYISGKSWLARFQSLDFMMLQGITAGSVTLRLHMMCNGANLLYRRSAFEEVNGFEGIDRVASGDDMLLMHKIYRRYPAQVFYLRDKRAVVRTHAPQTWKAFYNQRRRWASKTLVYQDRHILMVLGFVWLFNLLFLALFVAAFFHFYYLVAALSFWAFKYAIEERFIKPVKSFFGEEPDPSSLFWLQPLHAIYTLLVGIVSQFGTYEWKGRKTK